LVSFQIAGGEARAVQAASTDHKAFDQREGTFSTIALNVETVFNLLVAWRFSIVKPGLTWGCTLLQHTSDSRNSLLHDQFISK
jgi:hypothetical protein